MDEVTIISKTLCYSDRPIGSFSLVDEVLSNNEFKTNRPATHCREIFIDSLFNSMNSKLLFKGNYCNKHLSKLRVVFYNTGLSEVQMHKVVSFINGVETAHGIKRTTVSKALIMKYAIPETHKDAPKAIGYLKGAYLFEASIEWMHSSVLISLYLLLLRFNILNHLLLSEKNIGTVEKLIKFTRTDYYDCIHDFSNVQTTVNYWNTILANRNLLWPRAKNLIDYYDNSKSTHPDFSIKCKWTSWMPYFGIAKLVSPYTSSYSGDSHAYKTFHEKLIQRNRK